MCSARRAARGLPPTQDNDARRSECQPAQAGTPPIAGGRRVPAGGAQRLPRAVAAVPVSQPGTAHHSLLAHEAHAVPSRTRDGDGRPLRLLPERQRPPRRHVAASRDHGRDGRSDSTRQSQLGALRPLQALLHCCATHVNPMPDVQKMPAALLNHLRRRPVNLDGSREPAGGGGASAFTGALGRRFLSVDPV